MIPEDKPKLVWLRPAPRQKSPTIIPPIYFTQISDTYNSEDDWSDPPDLDSQDDNSESSSSEPPKMVFKYKKVAQKVRPVKQQIPEDMKTIYKFPEDPLKNLPRLPHHPPNFIPSTKVTHERMTELAIETHDELRPEEKKLLQHIILLNERSIAFNEQERGTFRSDYFSDYKIPTIDHEPWIEKNIPLPQGYKDELIQLLKDKIKAGVYERASTPYRSRWFYVKKKDGGLRIVHDLQRLNSVTIRDSAVPPIAESFIEDYAGRSVYTVLDMYWGFHARTLDIESRDMTAFQTPLGTFRLTSLPMGYANAPAEFQSCMTFILEDEIPNVADVFIDDVPIRGPADKYLTPEGKEETIPENPGIRRYIWEHINDVHRILHRIGEAGGTVSAKKMQLCRAEVTILGHSCSAKGREPGDARIQDVLNWPRPTNLTQLRGFIGLCGTVRIWIKDYSQLMKPLNKLTRKEEGFYWGPEQEHTFNLFKKLITSAPVLRPIDFKCDRPVILSVDTSIYGIGIILSQEDEQGRRAIARYGSIPLKPTEARYGQSKLELFGLYKALLKFQGNILGARKLIVEVDASSIEGMLSHPDIQASAVLNRWIQKILEYDFELKHVPAHKHKGPDALSRRPHDNPEDECSSDPESVRSQESPNPDATLIQDTLSQESHTEMDSQDDNQSSSHNSNIPSYPLPNNHTAWEPDFKLSLAAAVAHQITDEDLVTILTYLTTHKIPPFKTAKERHLFLTKTEPFFLNQAHMYRRRPGHPPQVVVFPHKRRREILWEMHEGTAHHGTWAVEKQTTLRYYWPDMKKQIRNHIRSCHTCQLRSTKKMHIPVTISHPPALFSKVYLDVMSMPQARGKKWLIGCRDDLSGITECKAIARDKAKVIARFFLKRIILRYGIVQEVVTDNGPSFGKEFSSLMKQYGIHHIKISPYNSQANGVVERGHYNIREAIVKLCAGNLDQWPLVVPAAVYADRITTRRATGFSPYFLLHGVHPLMPGDLADATFMVTQYKPGMTTAELIEARTRQLLKLPEDVIKARNILKQSRFRSKIAYENKFARRICKDAYKPGALVLIRNNPIENSVSIERKTADRYMGPYRIIRQTQGGSYILEEMDGTILRHHVAAYRLVPYLLREELDSVAEEIGLEDAPEDNEATEPSEDLEDNGYHTSDPDDPD